MAIVAIAQHAQIGVTGLGKPADFVHEHPLSKSQLDVPREQTAALPACLERLLVVRLPHLGVHQKQQTPYASATRPDAIG